MNMNKYEAEENPWSKPWTAGSLSKTRHACDGFVRDSGRRAGNFISRGFLRSPCESM
jgi:hypothetical protein